MLVAVFAFHMKINEFWCAFVVVAAIIVEFVFFFQIFGEWNFMQLFLTTIFIATPCIA